VEHFRDLIKNKKNYPLLKPTKFTDPIAFQKSENKFALLLYFKMLRMRKIEEKIASMISQDKIKCPCHLAIGQEAIARRL